MFTAALIWFYVELQPDWDYCWGEDRESDYFLNNVLCCEARSLELRFTFTVLL